MRNCVITIVGQKGAGKTQMARRLADQSPRLVIIDRLLEHEGTLVTTSAPKALGYLAENWRGDFRLVCRFRTELAHAAMFRYLAYTAQRCPTLPVSLMVEECDFFSNAHGMEPTLDYLYRYGRHARINLLAIARNDTDLHRSILSNTDALIAMRVHKFSKEMREKFDAQELSKIRGLTTLTPGVAAVKGTHYYVYPDSKEHPNDPFKLWAECQTLMQPQPTKGVDKAPSGD